jgi:hypothetical protein
MERCVLVIMRLWIVTRQTAKDPLKNYPRILRQQPLYTEGRFLPVCRHQLQSLYYVSGARSLLALLGGLESSEA